MSSMIERTAMALIYTGRQSVLVYSSLHPIAGVFSGRWTR